MTPCGLAQICFSVPAFSSRPTQSPFGIADFTRRMRQARHKMRGYLLLNQKPVARIFRSAVLHFGKRPRAVKARATSASIRQHQSPCVLRPSGNQNSANRQSEISHNFDCGAAPTKASLDAIIALQSRLLKGWWHRNGIWGTFQPENLNL